MQTLYLLLGRKRIKTVREPVHGYIISWAFGHLFSLKNVDDYLGEKLSHATVMHRVWDIIGDDKIFQFGIRSEDRQEIYWGKDHLFTQKFNFVGLEEVIEKLKGKPIYFTLDLDVLDPSVFPGTGTPEAGGVTFMELLGAILKVSKLNIVGMDVNELSPIYDQSGSSTALACKVLRELLISVY